MPTGVKSSTGNGGGRCASRVVAQAHPCLDLPRLPVCKDPGVHPPTAFLARARRRRPSTLPSGYYFYHLSLALLLCSPSPPCAPSPRVPHLRYFLCPRPSLVAGLSGLPPGPARCPRAPTADRWAIGSDNEGIEASEGTMTPPPAAPLAPGPNKPVDPGEGDGKRGQGQGE